MLELFQHYGTKSNGQEVCITLYVLTLISQPKTLSKGVFGMHVFESSKGKDKQISYFAFVKIIR